MSILFGPYNEPLPPSESHPASAPSAHGGYVGHTSYFGAQRSQSRGRLVLGPKDTKRQLSLQARTVMALKSRVLAENYGPGAALWNLAGLIGDLRARSASKDVTWAALANDYFTRVTQSPLTFDAGGRLTIAEYQRLMTYRRFVDGDMFSVLTESQSGHGRVMGYEGLCVESGPEHKEADGWHDGVKCNSNRFPLAYSFLNVDDSGKASYKVLPALSVVHHATFRDFSGRRGVPALAHCLNDFQDIIETKAFQKQMIKVASLIGLARKNDSVTASGLPQRFGAAAPILHSPTVSPHELEQSSSQAATLPSFEEAVEGGLLSSVAMDVIHDDRPHPNGEEFKKSLLREAAIGLGFPPPLVFFMDDPGGAWVRVELELAARAIAAHHVHYLAPFVRRVWTYIIAKGISIGELPEPAADDWRKIKLTPPRMPTADLGRMGRLYIELRKALMTTHQRYYEELGFDWEDELDQAARELRHVMDLEAEHRLPPGSLSGWLMGQGSGGAPPSAPAEAPPSAKK